MSMIAGPTPDPTQPAVIDRFVDSFGRLHVIDEDGHETILRLPDGLHVDPLGDLQMDEGVTPLGGSTFGVNVDWSGGTCEIRWSSTDDIGNNRSYVWVGLYGHTSGFRTFGNGGFTLRLGNDWRWEGYVDVSGAWKLLAARDGYVGHDAAGAASVEVGVNGGEVYGTSFNNVWGTQWHGLTNYVVLPYAPVNLAIQPGSVATTSFGVTYGRNSHDAVDRNDQAQWALDSGFGNVVWTDENANGLTNPAGASVQLTPGTTHYVRIRSHTSRGWGPWSATISQTTLPAVPPGLTIVATPSGTGATLTFTPPGGVTGATPYLWERRIAGMTTPVTSGSTPTTVAEVTGLTPGETYEWRGSAMIGTYQSPWTNWIPLQQPKPNVSAGDYFDGNTPDTPSLDYGWTGAPDESSSQAVGKGVDGWQATFGQSAVGAIHQVLGGLVGANAARVLIQIDATGPGSAEGGQAAGSAYVSEVAENATYVGSIYVNPSRSQRMRALLYWLDAGGTVLSSSVGVDQAVAGNVWTRLVATGVAPANAASVIVRVHDVAGSGHSNWKGGDFFLMDAAMISLNEEFAYFDGDTLDTEQTVYAWIGTAHASPSTATPAGVAGVATLSGIPGGRALVDPDCEPVPAPPRPPSIPSDCIEDVGVWRRYYVSIPAVNISDWLSVVPTLEILSGAVAARQVRIRFYPNPFDYAPDQINTNEWCAEQIISYMPASTVLTLDGVTMRAWAEVAEGDPLSADHLLYGTGGQPATWPILSCGISYLVSLEVPIDAPEGNISANAFVTVRS